MAISSNIYSSITPANADAIAATTAMNYRAQLKDNFFKDRPLFFWLRDKAKVRLDGGERIAEPLLYENNSTAQLGDLISEKIGIFIPDSNKILRYDGRPFLADELKREIERRVK